jgi:hypothetical protein
MGDRGSDCGESSQGFQILPAGPTLAFRQILAVWELAVDPKGSGDLPDWDDMSERIKASRRSDRERAKGNLCGGIQGDWTYRAVR